MRRLQHGVVVAVDRNVRVHVAIARVHVQRDPNPALEHSFVDSVAFGQDRLKRHAGEDAAQWRLQLRFPARAQGVVLQLDEQRVDLIQPALPLRAHLAYQTLRLGDPVFHQFSRIDRLRIVLLA